MRYLNQNNFPRSRRKRRDLSNLLIIPYTKYCGIGWAAKKYSEIGAFSKTGILHLFITLLKILW